MPEARVKKSKLVEAPLVLRVKEDFGVGGGGCSGGVDVGCGGGNVDGDGDVDCKGDSDGVTAC